MLVNKKTALNENRVRVHVRWTKFHEREPNLIGLAD